MAMTPASNPPYVVQSTCCKLVQTLLNLHIHTQSVYDHGTELCMQNAEGRVYVEFGAGKGYLSSMLADASKARDFVLLDVRGFRNKADRCSVACITAMSVFSQVQPSVQASHEPCLGFSHDGCVTDGGSVVTYAHIIAAAELCIWSIAYLQHMQHTVTSRMHYTGRINAPLSSFAYHSSMARTILSAMRRSLRKLEDLHLQRLTCDIKDFHPAGVEGLSQGQKPWVALGKHLCGAATDFTLRCCASSMQHSSSHLQQQQRPFLSQRPEPSTLEGVPSASSTPGNSCNDHGNSQIQSAAQAQRGALAEKQHLVSAEPGSSWVETARMAATTGADGCSSDPLRNDAAEDSVSCRGRDDQALGEAGVQGFAVATCCHHRCSWQHYVGKPLFKRLEFSPDEFEIISWMTGAVMLPSYGGTYIVKQPIYLARLWHNSSSQCSSKPSQCFPRYKDCGSLATQIHTGFLPILIWLHMGGACCKSTFPCRLVAHYDTGCCDLSVSEVA